VNAPHEQEDGLTGVGLAGYRCDQSGIWDERLRARFGNEQLPAGDVHVGPSDYVPWLTDRKWAHIRLEGRSFGDVPLNLELKLEVWDSPNSAGVVIDAVRCARIALDRGLGGALEGPSAYFMKSPPVQYRDDVARNMVEAFIDSVPSPTPELATAAAT
jgi:myo-inositol-1-phosphate synthase